MSDVPLEKPIYCNTCRNATRHRFVASHKYLHAVENGDQILWVCAGCDTATMEDYYSAAYFDDDHKESIFHPKRTEHSRRPKYFSHLPEKLTKLYGEVINANDLNLAVLCAIGLRALLEGICADKKIAGRDLAEKIDAMISVVPGNIVKTLHGFRFMGNNAAHELESPQEFELRFAIDLMEDILNFLYDLDYKAQMFARVPAAQKKLANEPMIVESKPKPPFLK